ncbi:hypothetical protein OSS47_06330 [Pseudomonas citronellolis]|uniref:hypothetical protein n=1 Tax=Pseudomonas citronellolis TaxID=53408 RepID=UPI002270FBD0|nr:hypothetical protein [Pseudomonas citronellolis]WAB93604.1 hypothetical protein OSS47_06330 [Pseudomonas citronellolis]
MPGVKHQGAALGPSIGGGEKEGEKSYRLWIHASKTGRFTAFVDLSEPDSLAQPILSALAVPCALWLAAWRWRHILWNQGACAARGDILGALRAAGWVRFPFKDVNACNGSSC